MQQSLDHSSHKKRHYRRGIWAERLAAFMLRCKGYTIVARRFKAPGGEIDIIARSGTLLVAVEVKARSTHKAALESIRPSQCKRIEQALCFWMQKQHRQSKQPTLRFDVIIVTPGRLPYHLKDAWRSKSPW